MRYLRFVDAKKAYARAGVDIDLGNRLKRKIQGLVRQTHGPEVLGKVGGFGGLFAPNFAGTRFGVITRISPERASRCWSAASTVLGPS